ncbi:MAG: TldD/PmbA family protein [Spirochaetales bacterium]|nr:TldD/PmbA family protein [Spirochaetales bacterium]
MTEKLKKLFKKVAPRVDYCSFRYVSETGEMIRVRQNILMPYIKYSDSGAMITVMHRGGLGYSATNDLSETGLKQAVERAVTWAEYSAGNCVIDFSKIKLKPPRGVYATKVKKDWSSVSLKEKIEMLIKECEGLKINDTIVDWSASLWQIKSRTILLTGDGGEVVQDFSFVVPQISVTANKGIITQTRTLGGGQLIRQSGFEVLEDIRFPEQGKKIAEEAVQLLSAPNCPSGKMDLLLAADQMILQIHESIGHPLELDRILGDERNYAGTSFVTPDMIGTYQYGTDLLNITFDPTIPNQMASYAFDDDGVKAEKAYLIEKGILKRALGSVISRERSGIPGVANSRASSWNRPPIDRMANLNLEPGESSLEEMVAGVKKGIYMKANRSWSIDDSRNKFQFGCEWAQLIEDGRLTTVVKNPNYRGISATFWRSLKMTGNMDTFAIMGALNCGKGEPNQSIPVGHASPACLFKNVDVFGGE